MPALGHRVDPAAVGAELRPTGAAQRQHGHVGGDGDRALRRLESQPVAVETGPAVTRLEGHPKAVEAAQPGAQQRRRLQRLGKHPSAAADECRLPEFFAPGPQPPRWERGDRGTQQRHGRPISIEKRLKRLAVGEIEAAPPGQQEFAPGRRHPVVNRDGRSGLRQRFGRDQSRRPCAHDRGDHSPIRHAASTLSKRRTNGATPRYDGGDL